MDTGEIFTRKGQKGLRGGKTLRDGVSLCRVGRTPFGTKGALVQGKSIREKGMFRWKGIQQWGGGFLKGVSYLGGSGGFPRVQGRLKRFLRKENRKGSLKTRRKGM